MLRTICRCPLQSYIAHTGRCVRMRSFTDPGEGFSLTESMDEVSFAHSTAEEVRPPAQCLAAVC